MINKPNEHTPGPWHVDEPERFILGGDYIEITMHDQSGMVADQIALIMIDTGDDDFEDRKRCKEQQANARLIAAAPELLEACKALQMEAASRGCGLRIADEAIAKATGGAR